MTPAEKANYLHACGISANRYGGRPDLMMEERPDRDFRRHSEEQHLQMLKVRIVQRRE
jgi:hypothetical protein